MANDSSQDDFYRTSVTVDEAVAMLMDWKDGPVIYKLSPAQSTNEDNPAPEIMTFDLGEYIDDLHTSLEDELDAAKDNNCSVAVIDQKRAALKRFHAEKKLAHTYLCAIEDQLEKDRLSQLNDRKLSNDGSRRISRSNFDEWSLAKYGKRFLTPIPSAIDTQIQIGPPAETLVPEASTEQTQFEHQKLRLQEKVILEAIAELGHDAKCLPTPPLGKRGVKSAVKIALAEHPLFQGTSKVFDTAWQRLRDFSEIANVE